MDKQGRTSRFIHKVERYVLEMNPDADLDRLAVITAELRTVPDLVQTQLCALSVKDQPHYTAHDFILPERAQDKLNGTLRLGWCEVHQTLHTYPRKTLTQQVQQANENMLSELKSLTGHERLVLPLWDMIINRYSGTLETFLHRHADELRHARMLRDYKRQVRVAAFFDTLTVDQKFDFYICGRKTPYTTVTAAENALSELPDNAYTRLLIVYTCDWCDTYHLGRRNKKNDYTGISDMQVDAYARFTWLHQYSKARKYVTQLGGSYEVTVAHDELAQVRGGLPRVFEG